MKKNKEQRRKKNDSSVWTHFFGELVKKQDWTPGDVVEDLMPVWSLT
jgi:hypothetical protein